MLLFVYGTLLKDEPAHGLLGSARWIADVVTEPGYTLLDMGEYPALVEGGETAVVGELYEVEHAAFAKLDEYEDCPGMYLRVMRPIAGYEAAMYLLRPELAKGRRAINGGDWRRRVESKVS